MTRLRIGHSSLNDTLHRIGKHDTGNCDKCGLFEDVKHVLLECDGYQRERQKLIEAAVKAKLAFNMSILTSAILRKALFRYLKETRLMERL